MLVWYFQHSFFPALLIQQFYHLVQRVELIFKRYRTFLYQIVQILVLLILLILLIKFLLRKQLFQLFFTFLPILDLQLTDFYIHILNLHFANHLSWRSKTWKILICNLYFFRDAKLIQAPLINVKVKIINLKSETKITSLPEYWIQIDLSIKFLSYLFANK